VRRRGDNPRFRHDLVPRSIDLKIARAATLKPITTVASELGLDPDSLEPYGRYKAKFDPAFALASPIRGKLVLVTGISPTPAGEGKTTTTIGVGDALCKLGKKAIVCLREPSMGPVFGLKGGATGGGYAQVVPMEDINLHFTGDFAAVAQAHNLLSALLDNHVHHGNALGIDVRRVDFRRVLDMNDRALRDITVGLGGPANGFPRSDGFDIVVASEVMAILCLATNLSDLKERLGKIVVARTRERVPITARDLSAHGAMAALLKHAIRPNLVQTLEGNPAFIHGGPFANIAHGCSSVIATRAALALSDIVITEAGFGADLGAEKFIDIKCRKAGLEPAAAVIVATVRALKYHGGVDLGNLADDNPEALLKGLANLERHVINLTQQFGLPVVVALNHFTTDRESEIERIRTRLLEIGVEVILARHWAEGGAGAVDLANALLRLLALPERPVRFLYPDDATLLEKLAAVATRTYGAQDIAVTDKVAAEVKSLEAAGFGGLPICVAKTPYSFSTDPSLRGAPSGHILTVRDVRLSAGAGFVVFICGDIMTMPGLPRIPAASSIDIDAEGNISGLF
jgi:formate--tetrahydrofolate ligase